MSLRGTTRRAAWRHSSQAHAVAPCLLAWLLAAACDAAPAPRAPGQVVLALGSDVCADYCLSALRVELYEYDQDGSPRLSGSPLQPDCGASDIAFDGLGAGRRVYISVGGYDLTSTLMLAGQSADLTVVAGESQSATVALAAVAPPTITSVAPDPVSVVGAGTLTLGGHDFMNPLGKAEVTLATTSLVPTILATTAWSDSAIVATLPAGAVGSEVTVTRCGVTSVPFPVRLVGATLGTDRIPQAPGCTGRTAVGLASEADGDVVAAFRCDAGDSYVQRFATFADGGASGLCPADPDLAWSLPGAPSALAIAGTTAWVALASDTAPVVVSLDLASGASAAATQRASLSANADALAAAADGSGVWALVAGKVVRVDGDQGGHSEPAVPVDGIDATWTATALAGANGRGFAVAAAADHSGRLVAIPAASGAVTSYSLSGCADPVALAASADGAQVVVACGGSNARRLLAFAPATATSTPIDLGAGDPCVAVALDGQGTGALVRFASGGASLVGLGAASQVGSWTGLSAEARGLTRLGDTDRFVVGTGGELDVLSPYDADGVCAP